MIEEICPNCEKNRNLCVCEAISAINNKTFVLILRHPQEQDKILGTAKIANLQLKNSAIKTGMSWQNLSKILKRPADNKRWGVLYLGTGKSAFRMPDKGLYVIDKKGLPVDGQRTILKNLEGIILLDGNWQQAKTLWWRNAWLLKCQRLVLQPERKSFYGVLRKEPRNESVSTIEAIAYSLKELESDKEIAEKLLTPFKLLLTKVREE